MSKQPSALMRVIWPFELEGRMRDGKLLTQAVFDRCLHNLDAAPSLVGQDHVAVERSIVFLHLPEMDMVDILDALCFAKRADNGISIHVRGAAQHQRPDRPANFGHRQI